MAMSESPKLPTDTLAVNLCGIRSASRRGSEARRLKPSLIVRRLVFRPQAPELLQDEGDCSDSDNDDATNDDVEQQRQTRRRVTVKTELPSLRPGQKGHMMATPIDV